LASLLFELVFDDLIFRLVLMEEPGHLLILTEELIVLSQDKFNFVLEFREFFALGFEECILFFKHGYISLE
jgi:hypothetical protein